MRLFITLFALLSLSAQSLELELLGTSIVDKKTLTFAEGPAAKFGLTANGRTHQQDPLITFKGYQYATYFNAERRVCIARRKLPEGAWDVISFKDHVFKTNDSHNTAVIGISEKDGSIHMAFDHHASQLNYRVSKLGAAINPETVKWDATLFTKVQHKLGNLKIDNKITYPEILLRSKRKPHVLLPHRDLCEW